MALAMYEGENMALSAHILPLSQHRVPLPTGGDRPLSQSKGEPVIPVGEAHSYRAMMGEWGL